MKPQRIGIFIGTFDPPHIGHRNFVLEIRQTFALDTVYVFADAITTYKQQKQPLAVREDMMRILFGGIEGIDCTPPFHPQPGQGTIWDIHALVRSHHPQDQVFLLMGTDTFTWYAATTDNTRAPADIIVCKRDATACDLPATFRGGAVQSFVQNDQMLSSSKVRAHVAAGIRPAHLTQEVWDYIRARGLYQSGTIGDPAHWIAREKSVAGNVGIEIVANPHLYKAVAADIAVMDSTVRAIDLGAGTGKLARDLLRADAADVPGLSGLPLQALRDGRTTFVSYEKDTALIDEGRKAAALPLRQCDLGQERLPEDSGSVDIAVSRTLLMHLSGAELAHHLEEVRRVLKPGCHYHIVTLNPDYQLGNLRWFGTAVVPAVDEAIQFRHGDGDDLQAFQHYYRDHAAYAAAFARGSFSIEEQSHPQPLAGWEKTHARYYRPETPLFTYFRLKSR